MSPNSATLHALDLHYFFSGLETLASILLLAVVAKVLLEKSGLFSKVLRSITWFIVALLAIAMAGLYGSDLYNYIHATRPFYQTAQHAKTGL